MGAWCPSPAILGPGGAATGWSTARCSGLPGLARVAFYAPDQLWEWIEQHYDEMLRAAAHVFQKHRGWRVVGLTSDDLAHLTASHLVSKAKAEGGLTIDTLRGFYERDCYYQLANLLRWQWVREHEPLEVVDQEPIMRLIRPPAD